MESFRSRHAARMLPFLVCGIVFMAFGVRQPAFLGVGLAMLGLAIAIGLGARRDGRK